MAKSRKKPVDLVNREEQACAAAPENERNDGNANQSELHWVWELED